MPGAQDRWGQLAEPGAPRYEAINADFPYGTEQPERGSIADLRRRMERLPPGHPSSPYNDDMTPKPPVARLKNLELPLHGTEQNSNGASAGTAHEPAEDGLADTRAASATSTRTSAANTARPVSASTASPVSARPTSAGTARPAPESTTTTASASNGASGRNRVASTLGTAEQLLTRDRLVTADEPHEIAEEPESVAGEPDGNGLDGDATDWTATDWTQRRRLSRGAARRIRLAQHPDVGRYRPGHRGRRGRPDQPGRHGELEHARLGRRAELDDAARPRQRARPQRREQQRGQPRMERTRAGSRHAHPRDDRAQPRPRRRRAADRARWLLGVERQVPHAG